MVICGRCGKRGGAWMVIHVLVHVLDLAIAAGMAAVVSGTMVVKWGWPGILVGAMIGMGVASFRERLRRRQEPPSAPGDNPGPSGTIATG